MNRSTGNFSVTPPAPRMPGKYTARNRTRANGDHHFGPRNCIVGLHQCQFHVLSYRTGNKNTICMPRRSNKLNAEATDVVCNCAQHIGIRFASVAPTGTDLPQAERSAKQAMYFGRTGVHFMTRFTPIHDETIPKMARHPMFRSKFYGLRRADPRAFPAENAPAQITGNPDLLPGYCIHRAEVHTIAAARRTLGCVNSRQAKISFRQYRGLLRILYRTIPQPYVLLVVQS